MRERLTRGLALVRRGTPRGPALRVRLYEKSGCGLCAEAHRVLTRVAVDVRLEIERVDIEGDAALFRRYGLRIPVLIANGRELDAAGLDEAAVRRWVAERSKGPPGP